MGRTKKDAVMLSVKLDRTISESLDRYCEETGQNRTTAIERMLSHELEYYFAQDEGKRVPR